MTCPATAERQGLPKSADIDRVYGLFTPFFLRFMGLPGHRRTSSHKRRRASHFALAKPAMATSKTGATHRPHRAAPGAVEYNGVAIHVKGREQKLQKMLNKTKSKTVADAHADHDHAGHDHEGHSHS